MNLVDDYPRRANTHRFLNVKEARLADCRIGAAIQSSFSSVRTGSCFQGPGSLAVFEHL